MFYLMYIIIIMKKKNEEHTIEQKEVDGRIILKFTQKSNKLSDVIIFIFNFQF